MIIGGGPAGLSAAVYAARARLSFVVSEKGFAGGGAISSTERVDNYLGLLGISGYELGEKFREHAVKLGAEIVSSEAVGIKRSADGFSTLLANGDSISSKTVIYAAGTSRRRLEVDGGELPGVSYCATCDGAFYKDKTVAVIGGGDTALSEALYLSRIAARVYLIHRRAEFRANADLTEQVKSTPNIELVLNAQLKRVLGRASVSGVEITIGNRAEKLVVDGVFAAIGSTPNTKPLHGMVDLDEHGYIVADENGKTSLGGFFAAGDVRAASMRQVITACSDGARCVDSAEKYLHIPPQ